MGFEGKSWLQVCFYSYGSVFIVTSWFFHGSWDLVNLNSNSFSDELSQFICGQVAINRIRKVCNNCEHYCIPSGSSKVHP